MNSLFQCNVLIKAKHGHKQIFILFLLSFLAASVVLITSSSIFLYDNNIFVWHCLIYKLTLLSRLHAVNILPSFPLEHVEYTHFIVEENTQKKNTQSHPQYRNWGQDHLADIMSTASGKLIQASAPSIPINNPFLWVVKLCFVPICLGLGQSGARQKTSSL